MRRTARRLVLVAPAAPAVAVAAPSVWVDAERLMRGQLDAIENAIAPAAAKAAKRGVWRGDVVAPWDWRRSRK